ncbi:MAG: glycoside hydrolase family 9 protein [Bryobacteraceae bacterium]|nr:glycoside hydrolase family 9 protein [Bryobacteraceae bacterium]
MRYLSLILLLVPTLAKSANNTQLAKVEPRVAVDQVGYLTGHQKVAIVVGLTEPATFVVKRLPGGERVFEGRTQMKATPREDLLAGADVSHADFSAVKSTGRYVVEVAGAAVSVPFDIGPNVYKRAFKLAMRSFYGQRCGTNVDMGPEFPQYRYDACHLKGAYHASSGKTGDHPSVKGWHDAGDYGRYIVNSGLTTGTLLWAWEFYGDKIKAIPLDIPESKNAVPDFLDEIRWNLDWMMTMQDKDGGVFHKQTTERFSGFVMPEKDTMPSVVIGTGSAPFKGTCATGDFAAVMAIASRVYKPYDLKFSAAALAAAEKAWAWAADHPNVTYRNPPGVSTGAYGDPDCSDERMWAAAELWRTTATAKYRDAYLEGSARLEAVMSSPPKAQSWPNVGNMAVWAMALGQPKPGQKELSLAMGGSAAFYGMNLNLPWKISMNPDDYVWGSNSVAANQAMFLLVSHRIMKSTEDGRKMPLDFRQGAAENLHYLLGRNVFSTSWVTHVGTNWFKHPHHRPSGADGIDEPWPGLLSGGPNRRAQDAPMRKLPDGLPPMRMWVDETESYASNENAINWNAALVFVLAGMLN